MNRLLFSILLSLTTVLCQAQENPAAPALKKLVNDYYKAIQSEDLEALTPLLAMPNKAALKKARLQYYLVFQATQVKVKKLNIKSVSVDESGLAAGVTVEVEAEVTNHDGSATHEQKGTYVIIANKREKGWGIVKVMHEAAVKLARKLTDAERREMELHMQTE